MRIKATEAAAAAGDFTLAAAVGRAYPGKLKFIPCRTAAGEKLLPGFEAELKRERDGAAFRCFLAVTEEDCFSAGEEGVDGVIGAVN